MCIIRFNEISQFRRKPFYVIFDVFYGIFNLAVHLVQHLAKGCKRRLGLPHSVVERTHAIEVPLMECSLGILSSIAQEARHTGVPIVCADPDLEEKLEFHKGKMKTFEKAQKDAPHGHSIGHFSTRPSQSFS